jgi:hypothetical protein
VESEKPERPIPFIKAAPNWRIGPAMFTAFAGLAQSARWFVNDGVVAAKNTLNCVPISAAFRLGSVNARAAR